MVKAKEKTAKLFLTKEEEIIEKLVRADHVFRKLKEVVDFEETLAPYYKLYSDIGSEGIDVVKGFKTLLVQFWEDYSDREMERCLEENVAVKWFCGFELLEKTPDHSYFGKLRKRLGTKNIADIFNAVNAELRKKGYFGDVFRFIDASAIITKSALWKERDEAIGKGEEALNNANVKNYAADKDARWGAKSKTNIWFGYKRHHNVDMKCGMIDKLAVTPANVPDPKALQEIITKNTMAFMDKIYDQKKAYETLRASRCHSGIIKKRNNKTKNKDLDSWKSKTRMPFEGNFSKLRKRAKFRSKVKVLMQCYLEAMAHNLKKAVSISPPFKANPT
jgi:IS5 family transposase